MVKKLGDKRRLPQTATTTANQLVYPPLPLVELNSSGSITSGSITRLIGGSGRRRSRQGGNRGGGHSSRGKAGNPESLERDCSLTLLLLLLLLLATRCIGGIGRRAKEEVADPKNEEKEAGDNEPDQNSRGDC